MKKYKKFLPTLALKKKEQEEVKSLVEKSFQVVRAVNHPLRLHIVFWLIENGEKEVSKLYIAFRCEQSVMSQHLRPLAESSILEERRDGKFIFYKVNDENWKNTLSLIESLGLNFKSRKERKVKKA